MKITVHFVDEGNKRAADFLDVENTENTVHLAPPGILKIDTSDGHTHLYNWNLVRHVDMEKSVLQLIHGAGGLNAK